MRFKPILGPFERCVDDRSVEYQDVQRETQLGELRSKIPYGVQIGQIERKISDLSFCGRFTNSLDGGLRLCFVAACCVEV